MKAPEKSRLDALLVERSLVETREKAQAVIMAGLVEVDGVRRDKPGQRYDNLSTISVKAPASPFVGRGGLKLQGALDAFGVDVAGLTCLDVGASTGGFTDCLLQRGALQVTALDVGHGQLHQKLRDDPRVFVIEKSNARYLSASDLPTAPELITMDVSFISVIKIIPALVRVVREGAIFLVLVKPQFEAGPRNVRHGVVRDRAIHGQVLLSVSQQVSLLGVDVIGLTFSPIRGPEGNIEFWLYGRRRNQDHPDHSIDIVQYAAQAVDQAHHEFSDHTGLHRGDS